MWMVAGRREMRSTLAAYSPKEEKMGGEGVCRDGEAAAGSSASSSSSKSGAWSLQDCLQGTMTGEGGTETPLNI